MDTRLKIIKTLAQQIINDIDSGACDVSEEDMEKSIDKIQELIAPKKMYSLYESAKFLGVSERTLRNYVKFGKLREPRSKQGWTEKFYYKEDLLEFKNIKSKDS